MGPLQVTVDEGQGRFGWLLLRASLHDPLLVLNVETELDDGESPFLVGACVSLHGMFTLSSQARKGLMQP